MDADHPYVRTIEDRDRYKRERDALRERVEEAEAERDRWYERAEGRQARAEAAEAEVAAHRCPVCRHLDYQGGGRSESDYVRELDRVQAEVAALRGLLGGCAPWMWDRIDAIREKGGTPTMTQSLAKRIDAALGEKP